MEETRSLMELLAAIVRQWKKVLLFAVVFALLLGGYRGYSLFSGSRSQAGVPNSGEAGTIEENTQSLTPGELMEIRLRTARDALAVEETYLEKSLLMNINPNSVYVTTLSMGFHNLQAQGGSGQAAPLDFLTKQIAGMYIAHWDTCPISAELDVDGFEGAEDVYIRELVTIESDEDGLLLIHACADSAQKSKALADAVYTLCREKQTDVEKAVCPFDLELVSSATEQIIDYELADLQRTTAENTANLQNIITALEKEQEKLRDEDPATPQGGISMAVIAKSAIKFGILGAVVGAILGCVVVWVGNILRGVMDSSHQVERVLTVPFVGSLAGGRNAADRLADRLCRERTWKEPEQAADYMVTRIAKDPACGKNLLFLSADKAGKAVQTMEPVLAKLRQQGIVARYVENSAHDPAAIDMLQECDGVILAETMGRSRFLDASDTLALVKNAGKPIIGFVTI